jgi:hypothetical protein
MHLPSAKTPLQIRVQVPVQESVQMPMRDTLGPQHPRVYAFGAQPLVMLLSSLVANARPWCVAVLCLAAALLATGCGPGTGGTGTGPEPIPTGATPAVVGQPAASPVPFGEGTVALYAGTTAGSPGTGTAAAPPCGNTSTTACSSATQTISLQLQTNRVVASSACFSFTSTAVWTVNAQGISTVNGTYENTATAARQSATATLQFADGTRTSDKLTLRIETPAGVVLLPTTSLQRSPAVSAVNAAPVQTTAPPALGSGC